MNKEVDNILNRAEFQKELIIREDEVSKMVKSLKKKNLVIMKNGGMR